MAKKKLSRDQKRKQKKRKAQQKRQQRAIKREKKMEAYWAAIDEQYELQELRIAKLFGRADAEDIPRVDEDTLQIYGEYLQKHLHFPCTVAGIESIGYFGWEEKYEFGYGDEAEHAKLRKEIGSLMDTFLLEAIDMDIRPDPYGNTPDIWVTVKRTDDGKSFKIPLSELRVVDQESENYWLLKDFTVWKVNW